MPIVNLSTPQLYLFYGMPKGCFYLCDIQSLFILDEQGSRSYSFPLYTLVRITNLQAAPENGAYAFVCMFCPCAVSFLPICAL